MKKTVAIILSFVVLLSGLQAFGDITERDLLTLESSYKIDVVINNAENANLSLKHNYGVDRGLTPDLIEHSFMVDVKSVDGEMLLYSKGEQLKNSGLSPNKDQFNFNFRYIVPNSAIPGIAYEVRGHVRYDDSFQSFDTVVGERVTLVYVHNKEGETWYGTLGNGSVTITKVGNEVEEEEEIQDVEDTPQGKSMALTFVKGLVQVKRYGTDEFIRARRNMILNPGDTVYTGKGSYADLGSNVGEFAISGHDISLQPRSIFTVPEEKLKVKRKSRMRMIFEDMKENVEELITGEKFVMETPSCAMSIRGTDFIVDVDKEGNTEVFLFDGSVYIESKHDGSNVLLEFGEKVKVNMDSPIEEMSYFEEVDWMMFGGIDYDSIPNYYEGLGDDEVIEDLESYEPDTTDNESEESDQVAVGDTDAADEETSEEGSSVLFWVIVCVSLIGIFFIVKTLIKLITKPFKK